MMKKLVSLLLALCLMTAAGAVFAEESYDVQVTMPDAAPIDIQFKDLSSYAASSTDKVSVTGTYHVIQFHGLSLLMDVPSGYMSVTQDYFSSLNYFSQLQNPDEVLQYMIDNEVHLVLIDTFVGNIYEFCYLGQDSTSSRIGNLSSLSEGQVASFGEFFCPAVGLNAPDEYFSANGLTWGRSGNIFFTVVGGHYVYVRLSVENDLTDDDIKDAKDLISLVTIYG